MSRALRKDAAGAGTQEMADAETLNIGTIRPLVGNLNLGGAAGSNVVVVAGQTVGISGATGALLLTGGADLTGAAGSLLSGFDSIEGIVSANLVDKTAVELVTGQWTFQAVLATNPKLIAKAAGGEAANSILFQVQSNVAANLFSVDVDGDVITPGDLTFTGGGTITTTAAGNLSLATDGAGVINAESFFNATMGLDVSGAALTLTGGVALTAAAGSALSGFDTIEGILSANLVDKTAGELITGQWTFQAAGALTNPKIIVKSNGAEAADSIMFQVQTSIAGNLFSVDTDGDVVTPGNLTFTGGGTITTTAAGDLTLATNGAGLIHATSEFNADAGLDVSGGSLTLVGGADLVAAAAGSIINGFTTIEGIAVGNLVDKTAVELVTGQWTFQAIAITNPKLIVKAAGAEAASSVLFQVQTAGAGNILSVDLEGDVVMTGALDVASNIDMAGTLSFDAGGTIDTSGANPLGINVGASTVTVTAALVDLRTSTVALDVPAGVGFRIGGAALTTANWTGVNVSTLLNGGDATLLHVHAGLDILGRIRVPGMVTAGMGQYHAGYVSANNTILPTDCSVATGTIAKATFAGVFDGAAGTMITDGTVEVMFDNGLACAPGDLVALSWTNPGHFTNNIVGGGAGTFLTRIGVILDNTNYAGTDRCVILLNHKHFAVAL